LKNSNERILVDLMIRFIIYGHVEPSVHSGNIWASMGCDANKDKFKVTLFQVLKDDLIELELILNIDINCQKTS
jgi:hypothetical protein